MNRYGFTLAEVLLALVIIGVVAALTIPAVITKVQQDQYVVGLKKAYNTLKSIERESIQANGEMQNWDWSGDAGQQFGKYFKPHFDILKDCGVGSDDGCMQNTYTKINGSDTHMTNVNSASFARILTSDGLAYAYSVTNINHVKSTFYVDVNGKKNPNKYGRDLFAFEVFPNMGIKPHGTYKVDGITSYKTDEIDNVCKTTGMFCSTKVLSEGAMNY